MQDQEQERMSDGYSTVAETLIEITGAIASGAETLDIFTRLARRCVVILPVAAAGILLRDVTGALQVIGASSPSAHLLDLFQAQNEEGPCLECLRTGEAVFETDIGSTGRWPRFSQLVHEHHFASVYALPLQSRRVTVGALNLFATQSLDERKLVIAQALANAATLSLLQVDPETDTTLIIQRIHRAVEARNTLDQASGMIAQRFGVDAENALERLADAAQRTGLSLTEVARAVVRRETSTIGFESLNLP